MSEDRTGVGAEVTDAAPAEEEKMSPGGYVFCYWPFVLAGVGGLVGGIFGGIAVSINMVIWKRDFALPVKLGLNAVVGVVTIVVWLLVVGMIQNAVR